MRPVLRSHGDHSRTHTVFLPCMGPFLPEDNVFSSNHLMVSITTKGILTSELSVFAHSCLVLAAMRLSGFYALS